MKESQMALLLILLFCITVLLAFIAWNAIDPAGLNHFIQVMNSKPTATDPKELMQSALSFCLPMFGLIGIFIVAYQLYVRHQEKQTALNSDNKTKGGKQTMNAAQLIHSNIFCLAWLLCWAFIPNGLAQQTEQVVFTCVSIVSCVVGISPLTLRLLISAHRS